jgi:hypothetical protein
MDPVQPPARLRSLKWHRATAQCNATDRGVLAHPKKGIDARRLNNEKELVVERETVSE